MRVKKCKKGKHRFEFWLCWNIFKAETKTLAKMLSMLWSGDGESIDDSYDFAYDVAHDDVVTYTKDINNTIFNWNFPSVIVFHQYDQQGRWHDVT